MTWADATRIAELFAVDPAGLGGVAVRAHAGPVRDRFVAEIAALLGGRAMRRMPASIGDDGLLGGLDLAATLGTGRAVFTRGVLVEADGGVVVVAMAERLSPGTAARISSAMDTGLLLAERDGLARPAAARFGVVALDEGEADELPPDALLDRLAFRVALDDVSYRELTGGHVDANTLASARARLAVVVTPPALLDSLSEAAVGLGIASLRAVILAVAVARAAAALDGRTVVTDADAAEAARLVLAPRATVVPGPPPPTPEPEPEATEADAGPWDENADEDEEAPDPSAAETVLEAARAAIPADLLARMAVGAAVRSRGSSRAGAEQRSGLRGRPAGSRAGSPRHGARLDVLATLRAAAPMQRLRSVAPGGRIAVRAADFHIVRRVQRARTTTIFVVDASGSSALHRLAEAKGAVELLLAECYVRRDRVALLAFRGRTTELILPPTASLTRAKRGLAGLPGGGGTPLAGAIEAASMLADAVRRQDGRAVIVLLTDGRANVTRDGVGDRVRAGAEALYAARALRRLAIPSLLLDTSPRPAAAARTLAEAMAAVYLPLPQADSGAMARAIQAVGS